MKKSLLFLFSIIITGAIIAQEDCADIFISEVVEGSGNNKAIEIYNPTDHVIDLADYVVKRYSNGSTTAPEGYVTDLVGSIQPDGVFILVNGQTEDNDISPACDPALQAMADQLDGDYPAPMYANGNDALTIEKKNGTIIDIYGKIGEDPVSGWYDQDSTNYSAGEYWWLAWTKDHTLIRKPEVKYGWPWNPGSVPGLPEFFMVQVEWDTVPGYLDEETGYWETQDIWSYLGWHDCDCHPSSVKQIKEKSAKAYIFPNPSIDRTISVKATEIINSVELYNLIGQNVYTEMNNLERGDMNLDLSEIKEGLYMVKVNLSNNKTVVKKLYLK